MKTIYICSPLRGDVEGNIERAKNYCRKAALLGFIPIAPHVYCTQFMNDEIESERAIGMKIGLQLLGKCDELWAFGDHISEGMAAEIALAKRAGIPVMNFVK